MAPGETLSAGSAEPVAGVELLILQCRESVRHAAGDALRLQRVSRFGQSSSVRFGDDAVIQPFDPHVGNRQFQVRTVIGPVPVRQRHRGIDI